MRSTIRNTLQDYDEIQESSRRNLAATVEVFDMHGDSRMDQLREFIAYQDRLARSTSDFREAAIHSELAQHYRSELRSLHQRKARHGMSRP